METRGSSAVSTNCGYQSKACALQAASGSDWPSPPVKAFGKGRRSAPAYGLTNMSLSPMILLCEPSSAAAAAQHSAVTVTPAAANFMVPDEAEGDADGHPTGRKRPRVVKRLWHSISTVRCHSYRTWGGPAMHPRGSAFVAHGLGPLRAAC